MVKIWSVYLCLSLFLAACTASSTPLITSQEPSPTGSVLVAPGATQTLIASVYPSSTNTPTVSTRTNESSAIKHFSPGATVNLRLIKMIDSNQGWATSVDDHQDEHILHTQDSGRTWMDITPPEPAATSQQDGKQLLATFFDAQHAWVVYWTVDHNLGPIFNPQVWKTQDAGQTWQVSEPLDLGDWEGGYTQPKFMEFADSQHGMLILGHDPGAGHAPLSVYRTTDGGQEWDLVRSAMEEPGKVIDVCCQTGMALLNPETAVMTMDPGPMGFTYWNWSKDGGVNWELQKTPPADAAIFTTGLCQTTTPLAVQAEQIMTVVNCLAESSGSGAPPAWLYRTTDLGISWDTTPLPDSPLGSSGESISQRQDKIWFQTANVGWLISTFIYSGGANVADRSQTRLYRTQDGSATWQMAGEFQGQPIFSFIDIDHAWAIDQSSSPAILRYTTDGAATWQPLRPEIARTQNVSAIQATDPDTSEIVHLTSASKFHIQQIQRSDTTSGWATAADPNEDEHILHTLDNGLTWQDVTPPEPASINPEYPKHATTFFLDRGFAWAIYPTELSKNLPLKVWLTTDGGKNWQASQDLELNPSAGMATPLTLNFINSLKGWLLLGHGAAAGSQPVSLYQTQDGGRSWDRILNMLSPLSGTINSCCQTGMVFSDTTNGIITTNNGADPQGHVNWTRDGGLSWQRQDLSIPEIDLPQAFCGTISPTIASDSTIFLVLECPEPGGPAQIPPAYLFRTLNFGETWSAFPLPVLDNETGSWQTNWRDFQLQFLDAEFGWLFIHNTYDSGDGQPAETYTHIYQTGNHGQTWQKLSLVNWLGDFSFIDHEEGWGLATNGDVQTLVQTKDGGRSWAILEMNLTDAP